MNPVDPTMYMEEPRQLLERAARQMEKAVVGKSSVISRMMLALLAGGHVLLEDVPGVGKTLLARSFARAFDLTHSRVQMTPDLMPSDITGCAVYHPKRGEFEFRHGPLQANLVLADELNRTPPRTQAALLEAMEEGQVTADGQTFRLPSPFMVIATQNPLEHEGTYRLPDAQLDRFMLKLSLGYPSCAAEVAMLSAHGGALAEERIKPQLSCEELTALKRMVGRVHVDEPLKQYAVELAAATRQHPDVRLGASPRATLALFRAVQAYAYMQGRTYAIPDDMKSLVPDIWQHRLLVKPEAAFRTGRAAQLLEDILNKVPVPSYSRAVGQ